MAARRAHLDAFGADRGAPWRDPTNGGRGPPGGPGVRALTRDYHTRQTI